MADHVHAPFTPEQVKSLNAYQVSGVGHPFTCEHDGRVLRATEDCWVCDYCGRRQYWAHSFMSDGSWRKSS